MRMRLSLFNEGKFILKKYGNAWGVGRGCEMAFFSVWETAWHFLFGVNPY
jgi:hypothetical protein